MPRLLCGKLVDAALAFALITAGGQARGQASSAPAGTLESAAAMVQARAFEPAVTLLRQLLSVDPENRRAKETLAFALESKGDLEGERQVRSALASEFPDDPRIQADLGRVLERSGDDGAALRADRCARELSAAAPTPELDAAIERMRGRTATEVATPRLAVMSDPEATASSVQAGAALHLGSRHHLALLGTHLVARARTNPGAASTSDVLALTYVLRHGAAYWTAGPSLHVVSPRSGARSDLGVGGLVAGRAPLGPSLEAEWRVVAETPWDEAAITVLRGGRTTAAEAHLYSHCFSRRLLLQAGARRRVLTLLDLGPQSTSRPRAWQTLAVAGADYVVWTKPGAAVRGEMLDEALVAPTTLSSALTVAWRHYDVLTQATPEFARIIGIAPRGSVHEASVATSVASPRGDVGLDLRAGFALDSARRARVSRGGGALIWAPTPTTRFALEYEEATEVASGLVGQRRAGWMSFHVDL